MSEKWMECPECHYSWYRYYLNDDDFKEVPVIIKTSFGWLCRLCRYEWYEDGDPVSQEAVAKQALDFRKSGKKLHEGVHSSNQNHEEGGKCMRYKGNQESRGAIKHNWEPFYNGMVNEMLRHLPEQGDSWMEDEAWNGKPMDEHLQELLFRAVDDYVVSKDTSQLIDIANFCAMIWSRYEHRVAWLIRSSEQKVNEE